MPICIQKPFLLIRLLHFEIDEPARGASDFPRLGVYGLDPMACGVAFPHLDMTRFRRLDCRFERRVHWIEELGQRVVGRAERLEVHGPYFVELGRRGYFEDLDRHLGGAVAMSEAE
jgi:hypothetical protein